jgi:hypothetical protein
MTFDVPDILGLQRCHVHHDPCFDHFIRLRGAQCAEAGNGQGRENNRGSSQHDACSRCGWTMGADRCSRRRRRRILCSSHSARPPSGAALPAICTLRTKLHHCGRWARRHTSRRYRCGSCRDRARGAAPRRRRCGRRLRCTRCPGRSPPRRGPWCRTDGRSAHSGGLGLVARPPYPARKSADLSPHAER